MIITVGKYRLKVPENLTMGEVPQIAVEQYDPNANDWFAFMWITSETPRVDFHTLCRIPSEHWYAVKQLLRTGFRIYEIVVDAPHLLEDC